MTNDSREALLTREHELRAARLVHDLRNPVNAFATSLALLEAMVPEEEGIVRRTLANMGRSVEEMTRLIEEYLPVATTSQPPRQG